MKQPNIKSRIGSLNKEIKTEIKSVGDINNTFSGNKGFGIS